jgi:WD40 repeat protein
VETAKPARQLVGHRSWVWSVAFSSDGQTLATAGYDHTIRLWKVSTGTEFRQIAEPQDLSSLAFLPGDKVLVCGGRNRPVRLWDVTTGKEMPRFGKGAHGQCAVCAEGKVLVTWSGHALRLWKVSTGEELLGLPGHQAEVRAAGFSRDGKTLLSAGAAGDHGLERCVWEAGSGRQLSRITGCLEKGRVLEFAPDRKTLAAAGPHLNCATVRLLDRVSGRNLHVLEHPPAVRAIAYSPDGKRLASASGTMILKDGAHFSLRLWDAATGRELRRFPAHDSDINALQFSPDGRVLASASWDKTARLWSTTTGKELRRLQGHANGLRAITFSPNGHFIATASQDGTVRLWETLTGGEIRKLDAWATVLAFAPDGKTLASVNGLRWNNDEPDNVIRFWDVATGTLIGKRSGHSGGVTLLLFSPDGKRLVSGSEDATLLAWDVSDRRPARVVKVPPRELQACWRDLADTSAECGYRAVWKLVADPPQTVSLLKELLRPASGELSRRIARLITDLDSDQFAVRQAASAELAKLGDQAEPALRKALLDKPSVEVRLRATRLLEAVEAVKPTPEQLRAQRAVEVLEQIDSRDARQLLETISRGDPAATLTREAKAVLLRLQRSGSR